MMNEEQLRRRWALLSAVVGVLKHAPDYRLPLVNLNKALFYLDLTSLRDRGHVVSEATYLALPKGPIVARYPKFVLEAMVDEGLGQVDPTTKAVTLIDIKGGQLDEYADQKAEKVAAWVAGQTAGEVSERSHQNMGWQLAYNAGLGAGGRAQPINMLVAMQQVVDEDAWVREELTDIERASVIASTHEELHPW